MGEMRTVYILLGKSEKKGLVGRHRRRWEEHIKQVRKCMHNMTILARSLKFDFCHIKYWLNIAHVLPTMEKENNMDIFFICFYFVIVASSVKTPTRAVTSCHRGGLWEMTSSRRIMEIKMYEFGEAFSGITSMPNFLKIHSAVLYLRTVGRMDR
jgi:hypothetical protein